MRITKKTQITYNTFFQIGHVRKIKCQGKEIEGVK